jgi:hypothetical protein
MLFFFIENIHFYGEVIEDSVHCIRPLMKYYVLLKIINKTNSFSLKIRQPIFLRKYLRSCFLKNTYFG